MSTRTAVRLKRFCRLEPLSRQLRCVTATEKWIGSTNELKLSCSSSGYGEDGLVG